MSLESAGRRLGAGCCAAVGLCSFAVGCGVEEGLDLIAFPGYDPVQDIEAVPPPEGVLRVTAIQVPNLDPNESGLLEMEVHLYEMGSGTFLGCSGAIHGMLTVDQPGVPYALNAYFVRPGSVSRYPAPQRAWLTHADVRGRMLKVVVVEDDDTPCPLANDGKDKVFEQLEGISGDSLRAPTVIPMTLVPRLIMGAREVGEVLGDQ
jgi:hypothetical protein